MDINVNSTKKVNLSVDTAETVYRHYKGYLLPVIIILSCFLILFLIIIPQAQQYFSAREVLKTEEQKLSVLKNNYNFLSSLDDAKLDSDLKSLSSVLPGEKDFAGIINAISIVSAKTGVTIGDFEFAVGDLSKTNPNDPVFPSIKITANLGGSAKAVAGFISELYKTAPLAEVTVIKLTGSSSSLTILFYYKTFPPQNINEETPIVPFSTQGVQLISDISKWNNNAIGESFLPLLPGLNLPSSGSGSVVSSVSAGSNPSPF